MQEKKKTFCRNCGALCSMDVTVEDNKLIAVSGDGSVSPYGHYMCVKGLASIEFHNGAYLDAGRTRKKYPVNWAYMNPEDMAKDNIAEGDTIDIISEAGKIQGVAKAEDKLRAGVVSMTHMFGRLLSEPDKSITDEKGSYTGRLTSLTDYLESVNFMPRFSGIPINVAAAAK